MKFAEITISTTTEAQELVADILWNYTSYGVAISDVKDVVDLMNDRSTYWDYIDDEILKGLNDKVTLVKAYIALEIADETFAKIREDLENLKKNGGEYINFGSLEIVRRTVEGDDWIEIWKKHYKPIDLGKVVVCPAWINHKPKEGQVKIIIDSNMAFGTGEHETTSMVLKLAQEYIKPSDTVVDVGTGSGILGIAAAKLGAKKVVMTDIDFVAVQAARHNCEINGVADKCEVALNNLLDEKNVVGDILLANITADILLVLSNSVVQHVKKGGIIVLSGIIKGRVDEVVEKYSSLGFEFVKRTDEGEWIAVVMKKL